MKKLILFLTLIGLFPFAALADELVAAGVTSRCMDVFIQDNAATNGAGKTGLTNASITAYYHRIGASGATVISLTGTGTVGTFTSALFKEIDATNMPGEYFICLPDAMLASGASESTVFLKGADIVPRPVRFLLSPSVNIASASSGSIEEQDFAVRGIAQSVAGGTIVLASTESFGDTELAKNTAVHIVSATTGAGQTRCICSYVGSTDTATLCENWTTTPTGTITYDLLPAPHCDALEPTVIGRTLDVATTGEAGVDLSNVLGTLDALEIGADAITAAKIANDAIDATEIANDTIDATEIAAASITNSEFIATPTVGGFNVAGLTDLFGINSGTTYSAAVAGSVVKEIADNASGGGGGGGGDFMISTGTAQSVTAGPPAKMRLAVGENYGNNALSNNASVLVLSSSGSPGAVGQVLCIKSNSSAIDEVTFTRAYKIVPSGTVTYAVIPTANCNLAEYPVGH